MAGLWARQSEEVGKEPVGIYSHHPFPGPEPGLQSAGTSEVLVALVQKVLLQIKSTDPALFLIFDQLSQLEDLMEMNRKRIWANKKVFPESFP